jgi:hypothetical protein
VSFCRAFPKKEAGNIMIRNTAYILALGGLIVLSAGGLRADDNALLDVLVKKGVLTDKEAGKLGAEAIKPHVTPQRGLAGNIKTGDQGQELALYGDLRFRDYYQTYSQQLPTAPVTDFDKNIQRQSLQFRLRLDADFKPTDKFFGGVQFSTSNNR